QTEAMLRIQSGAGGGNLATHIGASLSDGVVERLLAASKSISPDLGSKVRELLDLEVGWDGEDAKPVGLEVLTRTVMLLRRVKQAHSDFVLPFIAPTFEGSVLLDWTSPQRSLEVQARPSGWSATGTLTTADGRKQYFSGQWDLTGFGAFKYYDWFRDELLIWPTE
ncbi:MAG: hypothetical protein ABI651_16635, partial [Verrucomicrobiota bacterium]